MTIWPGEFKFAGDTICPSDALSQTVCTSARSNPSNATTAPTPTGTASCIYRPRLRTNAAASPKLNAPAATNAEYSPKLWPATKCGRTPFSSRTRKSATDVVRIAGCVVSVNLRSSSGPLKHNREMGKSKSASASSKAARAVGNFSATSRPIPMYCAPWPGKTNAIFIIRVAAPELSRPRSLCDPEFIELGFNDVVHVVLTEIVRDTDGVLDGVGI